MKKEYEIVPHPRLKHICCFLVDIDYRTPHLHRELELSLVLNGDMTVTSMRETTRMEAGSLFLMNSSQAHEYKSIGSPARMLCVQVSPQFFKDCLPYFPNVSFDALRLGGHLSKEEYERLRAMLVELTYRYFQGGPGYEFVCRGLLHFIMHLLISRVPFHMLSDDALHRSRARVERLNRILDYIDANYMNKLLLADIAKTEDISPYYLSHFFKENLGRPFQEYLSGVRFSHARSLVAYTDKKLLDICMECGFSDYRYLYRAFSERLNCTPTEYRNRLNTARETERPGAAHSIERFLTEEETLTELAPLSKEVLSLPIDIL
ncbi:MAG TPA: AraC family transcriptional regulator [Feifaniaceae bacterium]|nr:AraC family transcriptional regulator [Feifaniaceae bacterium]